MTWPDSLSALSSAPGCCHEPVIRGEEIFFLELPLRVCIPTDFPLCAGLLRKAAWPALDAPAPFASGEILAEAMLIPTRIYVHSILGALEKTEGIKALAHIIGGGFPEKIPRILPKELAAEIDLASIRVPPVFS